MIRAAIYLVLGWLLVAFVGGMADVLALTVMLPATSAVVLAHAAFSRTPATTVGLALALGLGYLEDLHQGAPVGTLALSYSLSFLVLRWASGRIHLQGWVLRAAVSLLALVLIDVLTFGVLMALADSFMLRREALWHALWDARWHALATLLVAPPVWALLDRVFTLLKVEDEPAERVSWSRRG